MKRVLRSRRLRTGRGDFTLLASATDSNGIECQCTKTGQGALLVSEMAAGPPYGSVAVNFPAPVVPPGVSLKAVASHVIAPPSPKNCIWIQPTGLAPIRYAKVAVSVAVMEGLTARNVRTVVIVSLYEMNVMAALVALPVVLTVLPGGNPGLVSVRQRPRLRRRSCPSSTWRHQNRRRTCAVWHLVCMGETTCQLAR